MTSPPPFPYTTFGTFTVTHRATGRAVVDEGCCIECARTAGRQIAALNLDWSAVTADNSTDWANGLSEETKAALVRARSIWCEAEFCAQGDGE